MTAEKDYSHIPGWGADLNRSDRPAYPKERIPARLTGVHWDQPEQQRQTVEILVSNERPGITPIFGTSTPPSGVSGMARRFAFKFSENDVRHWLILLFADRVNVVEGVIGDLRKGKVPNLYEEMGLRAEFKYNRSAATRKLAIGAGVLGIAYLVSRKKR